MWVLESDTSSNPLIGASTSAEIEHDLTDADGSLEFQGTASARASFNTLSAQAGGALYNSFFDPDYDFDSQTGVPQNYGSFSSAEFTQTLSYGGMAMNYTSTYILRLTGTILTPGYGAVTVRLTHGNETPQEWSFLANDSYDIPIFSQAYVHGVSPQQFSLAIFVTHDFDTGTLAEGGNYEGSVLFGNTLRVEGVDLRDENGNLAPPGTITSNSGEVFQIMAVPEPGTLALVPISMGMLIFSRRRRE